MKWRYFLEKFKIILFPERKTAKFLDKFTESINSKLNSELNSRLNSETNPENSQNESYRKAERLEKFRKISDAPTTYAFFEYKNPKIEKLIHIAKYQDSIRASEILAGITYKAIINNLKELSIYSSNPISRSNSKIILIPIPSSLRSLEDRGFNHLERILFAIEKIDLGENIIIGRRILSKNKNTERQATVNKEKREKNLEKAFTFDEKEFEILLQKYGKNNSVFIFDDVSSTGATIKESYQSIQNVLIRDSLKGKTAKATESMLVETSPLIKAIVITY